MARREVNGNGARYNVVEGEYISPKHKPNWWFLSIRVHQYSVTAIDSEVSLEAITYMRLLTRRAYNQSERSFSLQVK